MAKTKSAQSAKGVKSDQDVKISKSKSQEMAKEVSVKAGKEDKKSKKVKKEPTPEPSSDESASDEEVSSASSASSDDEKPIGKTNGVKTNGAAKPAAAAENDSSESSSSSDDEDDAPAPKSAPVQAAKIDIVEKENSDSEDGSEGDSEEDSEDGSEEDSSEDESADDIPAVAGAIDHKALNGALEKIKSENASSDEESGSDGSSGSDSGSGSEEDSSEDDSTKETPAPKKRKAEVEATPVAKKAKTDTSGGDASKANLFVGSLSWNVDEDWLTREFESFGELSGVRIITDKDTGRSKGFGYVEFTNPEDGIKAQKAMHGTLLDNRALNVDFSTPRGDKPDRGKQYGDQKSPPSDTLFVANISFEATEDIIGEEFGKHGDVIGVRLPTDQDSGNPKGFGYVQFSSIEGATEAMEGMSGAQICGRPIRLDFSTPRTNTDDSPRGGRGGRGGGRGGFDRGGRGGGRGRGGFDRGGRGGGRGDRGGRGGRGGSTNRGGFGDFQGKKMTF